MPIKCSSNLFISPPLFKKMKLAIFAFMVALLVDSEVPVSMSVNCKAAELSPYAAAMTSPVPPSPACCSKLSEQKPCLCTYMKDPKLKKMINSPYAKKISTACKVPYPTNCLYCSKSALSACSATMHDARVRC